MGNAEKEEEGFNLIAVAFFRFLAKESLRHRANWQSSASMVDVSAKISPILLSATVSINFSSLTDRLKPDIDVLIWPYTVDK